MRTEKNRVRPGLELPSFGFKSTSLTVRPNMNGPESFWGSIKKTSSICYRKSLVADNSSLAFASESEKICEYLTNKNTAIIV